MCWCNTILGHNVSVKVSLQDKNTQHHTPPWLKYLHSSTQPSTVSDCLIQLGKSHPTNREQKRKPRPHSRIQQDKSLDQHTHQHTCILLCNRPMIQL